ncbi:Peptidyl-prolyl cis-trans isomerase D [Hartmannibacter diazotrophicus]|uniref:Parvulin-like PPIase n=1 Tax=Hartmannibacter diazotrophicus TaxID=1482074 RepID=A0A2C9D3Z9_9HYPH|nr:SurA N-terminal domain-containing protein [Hartmannibacter diazotrophicus]SON55057.1 Peptidyl-prolyl cis-trans isomerase D [Hartmannibacter diazotrophicus]
MLDALRRGANTFVAKILLGLLVASFGVWGISGSLNFFQSDAVATVGGEPVNVIEFQRTYEREVRGISNQIGQPISSQQAAAFGLPQRVLGQIISEAALSRSAQDFGVGISDTTLANEIANDKTLQRDDKFDRAFFQQLLRNNGLTENQYVADRRNIELRKQVIDGLFGGMTPPKSLVEAIASYRSEVRDVDYVKIDKDTIGTIADPADEDLKTYFEAHKDTYKAPEYRTVEVMTLTPEVIADPAAVSEDDVKAEYERNQSAYGAPETRNVHQILFPNEEDAKAAKAKIDGGASFADIVKDRGMTDADADLGTITKDKIIDPAVADAAFSLTDGKVSDPIKTQFGSVLVMVSKINPPSIKPLADVEADIRKDLAERLAERNVLDMHDSIEDALAGGSTLKEVAERFKLKTETIADVDAQGRGTDGQAMTGLPAAKDFLSEAFQSDIGVENAPLQIGRYGYTWYEIAKVTPARDRTLDEVHDKVLADWRSEETAKRIDAKASDLFKEVKDGKSLADVAAAADLTVETSEKFTRGTKSPSIGKDAVEAAFGGPEGFAAMSAGPDGSSRLVMTVKDVVPVPYFAESAEAIDIASKLSDEMQNGLLSAYLDHLQTKLGVDINQTLLQSAIGLGGS